MLSLLGEPVESDPALLTNNCPERGHAEEHGSFIKISFT
jgi:hypothetical protein